MRCFDVVVRATEMFGKVELTGQNALVLALSPAKRKEFRPSAQSNLATSTTWNCWLQAASKSLC